MSLDTAESNVIEYRSLSPLAVLATAAAVASIIGFLGGLIGFFGWLMAVLGLLLGVLALVRLRNSDPPPIGKRAAWFAVALAGFMLVGAPSEWITRRYLFDYEAREFALQWFNHLRQGEPLKAHQFTVTPGRRLPFDENLAQAYAPDTPLRNDFNEFMERPEIKALLALGKDAQVRYYETVEQRPAYDIRRLSQMYAITYEDENGEKKTYFMVLTIDRYPLRMIGLSDWVIIDMQGGICPPSLEHLRPKHPWEKS